jgi:hypothetical protein
MKQERKAPAVIPSAASLPARYDRRAFLRGLGLGAGLLPLLDAEAAFGAPFPKRLLIVVWTNGTVPASFWPTGTGVDLAGLTLPAITAPLAPYTKDLLFVSGLETKNFTDLNVGGFGHQTYSTTFTGTRGTARRGSGEPTVTPVSGSIDQRIADEVAKRAALPLRSLHLGVLRGGNQYYNCCFYRGAGAPVTPELDPAATATKLFAGMRTGSSDLDKARLERRSLLDFSAKEITAFRANLGTEDRRRIDAHADSLREVEKQIARLGNTTCMGPAVPAIARTVPNYPMILNAQTDVLVGALRCDLTRVATLQLGDYNGDGLIFSWIGLEGKAVGTDFGPNKLRDWHDCAHTPRDPANPDPANKDHKIKLDTWMVQQFAALIKKLKDTPEAPGSMLDNTAILFANHMTDGSRHNWDNLPWFIAGGLGGAIKPGRFLRATTRAPSNKLFVSLARAMEVDVPNDTFGDPEYAGALAGLGG